jgi:hypothetical protein
MRIAGDWQTGLEDENGAPKPAYAAFRTPVVAQCRNARAPQLLVWGRWRGVAGAIAQVQRLTDAGWAPAGRPLPVAAASAAVQTTVAWAGGAQARIHWSGPGGPSADSPGVIPQPCGGGGARAARHHPHKRAHRHRKMRRSRRRHAPIKTA